MPYNPNANKNGRAIASNVDGKSIYHQGGNATPNNEPCIKLPSGTPVFLRSKGFDFAIEDTGVFVHSHKHGKNVFSITEDAIIIGDPNGEHINVKL
jgi:hypothetical protein